MAISAPDDPNFAAAWETVLRRIGDLLERDARQATDQSAE
jgi:hypothetical protein